VDHFRARVARYALAVVVCQLLVVCAPTIVMAASPRPGGLTVASDEECRCEHTAGVMCPMHRRSSSRPIPSGTPRWCQGVDDSAYAVLPVFGTLALPERVTQFAHPLTVSRALTSAAEAPRPLDRPPDSPPPRA
jgi:hypothetical protein